MAVGISAVQPAISHYVPAEARRVQIDVALSNAMGLAGHNARVLIGRVE